MRARRGDSLAQVVALALACATLGAASAASENIWKQESLGGDWGGLRGTLADQGVSVELVGTSDVMGVVAGGIEHDTEYLSDVDLMLTFETEPLLGWKGGTIFVYGLGLLNTGSPSENAGDTQTLDNIDARRNGSSTRPGSSRSCSTGGCRCWPGSTTWPGSSTSWSPLRCS